VLKRQHPNAASEEDLLFAANAFEEAGDGALLESRAVRHRIYTASVQGSDPLHGGAVVRARGDRHLDLPYSLAEHSVDELTSALKSVKDYLKLPPVGVITAFLAGPRPRAFANACAAERTLRVESDGEASAVQARVPYESEMDPLGMAGAEIWGRDAVATWILALAPRREVRADYPMSCLFVRGKRIGGDGDVPIARLPDPAPKASETVAPEPAGPVHGKRVVPGETSYLERDATGPDAGLVCAGDRGAGPLEAT